jgi:hemoglobin/transferrin/lactoferrin receptor protein
LQIINNSTPVRFHTLKLYFLFTHLLSFLSSAICIAQEDSTIVLTDVVVSGTRFESLLNESPQEIEIIDKKQIAFQNTGNSAMLLEQSGEVFVQKSQAGGGSPVVRGFEANKVLIVVDGVRMNNAIFRGGHLQNVLRVDQNILERVEVVKGPSSVHYGSDALGGVIHFRTKEAQYESFHANAYVRHGTVNNENTLHIDLNAGFKELAFLSSFTASHFGDLRMGQNFKKGYEGFGLRNNYLDFESVTDLLVPNPDPFIQTPSGYSQFDFLQKMKFKTGKIIHRFNYQASLSTSVPRYDRLTDRNTSGGLRFAEWKYGPEVRLLGAYSLELPSTKLYDKASLIGSLQYFN